MKTGCQIFLLVMVSACFIYAQEQRDTINKSLSFSALQKLQIQYDEFEIYRQLNYMKMNVPAKGDSNTIWMWTLLTISNSNGGNSNSVSSASDMISPLYLQFQEESRLNPVRYVLGMAQTAAVGYLAYRHIKKYGLFK